MEYIIATAVALVLLLVGAARRRRRMGRYLRGNIDINLSVSTLAGATGLLAATQVTDEKTLVSSVKCIYSLADVTPIVNNGPLQVGVAHSDYSLTEIEAWIEQTSSWTQGDKVAREISSRFIRSIGTWDVGEAASQAVVLNDGKPITTKLNWVLTTGQGLNFWVYNEGSAAYATTNPNAHIVGHANLWPR